MANLSLFQLPQKRSSVAPKFMMRQQNVSTLLVVTSADEGQHKSVGCVGDHSVRAEIGKDAIFRQAILRDFTKRAKCACGKIVVHDGVDDEEVRTTQPCSRRATLRGVDNLTQERRDGASDDEHDYLHYEQNNQLSVFSKLSDESTKSRIAFMQGQLCTHCARCLMAWNSSRARQVSRV